ncbi:hypothetical protein NUW58_g6526 [Xylaria curta]|uniref:Uncharacterized protein n=1 Tax=Xylaria curta TaxID=42375 RepID=A0ACC1NRY9_9PEZI|nr:hypothetical protein NUW58_g6526 [Xylaria curta]
MQANSSRQLLGYTPDCPYFQKQSPITNCSFLPMCRLKETFEDGRMFTADSFGDRDWIDVTDARPCKHDCLCNKLSVAVEERAFSFIVEKTPTDMKILFHDIGLRDVVTEALAHTNPELVSGDTPGYGFLLLRYRPLLAEKLWQMQQDLTAGPQFNFVSSGVTASRGSTTKATWRLPTGSGFMVALLHGGGNTKFRRRRSPTSAAKRLNKSTAHTLATSANESNGNNCDDNWSSPYVKNSELLPIAQELISKSDSPSHPRSTVNTKAAVLSGRPNSGIRFPRLQTKLFGSKTDVDRNAELWNAISSQDIVRVQNILQRADEAFKRDEMGLGSHHQAGKAHNNIQIDAQLLLLAVKMDCPRCTKLLLNHGYDVNCHFKGETPLSSAAISGSDSLVRLLLRYGAEVSVAALILQSREDRSSIRRIDSLAQPYKFQVTQKTFKCNRNLIRLRNNFWKEHTIMSKAATNGPFTRASKSSPWTITPPFQLYRQPFFIEKNVRLAWSASVATTRSLCNGKLPSDTHEALLFLALVKSMTPIIGEYGGQDLEDEFFADLSRWQLVFRQDTQECSRFKTAVKAIWDIDVTQSRLDPLEDRSGFASEILHIQDLTNCLVNQAYHVFQFTGLSELELPNVQARWRARQATSKLHHPEKPAHCPTQDNTHTPFTNDSPLPVEMEGAKTLRRLEEGLTSDALQKSECSFTPDPILVTVLAGSIFAIILAFLLLLRSLEYCDAIKVLFPLAVTVLRDGNYSTVKYNQTRIAKRSRVLLGFYLERITPMAYGQLATTTLANHCRQA